MPKPLDMTKRQVSDSLCHTYSLKSVNVGEKLAFLPPITGMAVSQNKKPWQIFILPGLLSEFLEKMSVDDTFLPDLAGRMLVRITRP